MAYSEFGYFGANKRRAPQIINAQAVLGIGCAAQSGEARIAYLRLMKEYHPDLHHGKPTQEEAERKSKIFTDAYELLTNPDRAKAAEKNFQKALHIPFVVGHRVFQLGSLYGVRNYIPDSAEALRITNPGRLLATSENKPASADASMETQDYSVYGVRNSILESGFADLLEMFYGGEPVNLAVEDRLVEGFKLRSQGGMEDLPWIRRNNIGIHHFLERDFVNAVKAFNAIHHKMINDNIIIMYRYGIALEARVAEPGYRGQKPKSWKQCMDEAVGLYSRCLFRLKQGKGAWLGPPGHEQEVQRHEPSSTVTIMMQLADAYQELGGRGNRAEAKRLWHQIRRIEPECIEAVQKARTLIEKITNPRGILGLLKSPRPAE
ncbi:MAG: DnaJ domain-containing protein [Planctomycetota bacterium]|nr:DnaJ domain-containing protein [Planctomycetota bacterium]